MSKHSLSKLESNVKSFFKEFKKLDIKDLSTERIQTFIDSHHLGINDIKTKYSERPIQM